MFQMLKTLRSVFWGFARGVAWLLPFIVVLFVFSAFFVALALQSGEWKFPTSLPDRGQFGDSFGVLNSLFTGLGFAGLLVTIALQQKQIHKQAKDFHVQLQDTAIHRYEDNLFRLLGLYQEAVNAVISTRDGQTTSGRDVLRLATESLMKSIRQDKVNSVPHEIQKRYQVGALTPEDRDVLDFLYYRNFWHLNYGLIRQGRLLESLKALFNHLEHGAPENVERNTYRRIILSQITHIEVSYFFFIALGTREEAELRELLLTSGLMAKMANIYKPQVHRYMYAEFWGHDVRRDKTERALPIPNTRIKALKRKETEIRTLLAPIAAAAVSIQHSTKD